MGIMEGPVVQARQKERTHKKLSTRVYCVDIIRAVCILGMTLVHSFESSVDLNVIFTKYLFLLPILGVICIFTQFRGFFLYVSAMIAVYRFSTFALSQLLDSPENEENANKSRNTYLAIMKQPIIQLFIVALAWPLLFLIDSIRLIGETFRMVIHATNDYVNFVPSDFSVYAFSSSDPVSAIMIINAILLPGIGLMLIAAHAITKRIHFKVGYVSEKKCKPFKILAYDQAAAIVAITGGFFLIVSLITAVTRWPFDQAVARSVKRVYEWNNVVGADKTCDPSVLYSCSLVSNNVFKQGQVVNMLAEGHFNPAPFFYQVFAKQLSGTLMGLSPFAINYLAGAFMGLLLTLFKRSAHPVKDIAPRAQLTRREEVSVLWSWSMIYMAVLLVAFAIWLAIYPYEPFGQYRPWAYNGPYILGHFGIKKGTKEIVVEKLGWHSGAYELELTTLQILCGTILVHWCELGKVATRMCREDGAHYGEGPFIWYKRKQHVPLRFLRRFSTYSVTVFYFFDEWIYCLLFRIAQLTIPQCNTTCTNAGIFYPLIIAPVSVFVFMWMEDFSYGFLSVDFLVTLTMKLVTLVVTAVAMPLFRAKQLIHSPKEFSSEYKNTLMGIFLRIFTNPPSKQHNGVRVERFFPVEIESQE